MKLSHVRICTCQIVLLARLYSEVILRRIFFNVDKHDECVLLLLSHNAVLRGWNAQKVVPVGYLLQAAVPNSPAEYVLLLLRQVQQKSCCDPILYKTTGLSGRASFGFRRII